MLQQAIREPLHVQMTIDDMQSGKFSAALPRHYFHLSIVICQFKKGGLDIRRRHDIIKDAPLTAYVHPPQHPLLLYQP